MRKNNFFLKKITALVILVTIITSCDLENNIGSEIVKIGNLTIVQDTNYKFNQIEQIKYDSLLVINNSTIPANGYVYVGKIEDKTFGKYDAEFSFLFSVAKSYVNPDTISIEDVELVVAGATFAVERSRTRGFYPSYPFDKTTDINVYLSEEFPKYKKDITAQIKKGTSPIGKISNFLPYKDFSGQNSKIPKAEKGTIKIPIDKDKIVDFEKIFFNKDVYNYIKENNIAKKVDLRVMDSLFLLTKFKGLTISSSKLGCLFTLDPNNSFLRIKYKSTIVGHEKKIGYALFSIRSPHSLKNLILTKDIASYQNVITKDNSKLPSKFDSENDSLIYIQGFNGAKVKFSILDNNGNPITNSKSINYLSVNIPIDTSEIYLYTVPGTLNMFFKDNFISEGKYNSQSKSYIFDLTAGLLGKKIDFDEMSIRTNYYSPNRVVLRINKKKVRIIYSTLVE